MKTVIVNTSHSNAPAGCWTGNPEHAKECDYLIEENNGEIKAIYEFSGVSDKDKDGKFNFKGLKEVTDSVVIGSIKSKVDISRKRGEQQSLRYKEI